MSIRDEIVAGLVVDAHTLSQAASYQAANELDSILNYPMYGALVDAFAIPGALNTSALAETIEIYPSKFKVISSKTPYHDIF